MYRSPGETRLVVKIWGFTVKCLVFKKALTYSLQSSLPRLPVPSLKHTITSYLDSMKPLLNEKEYSEVLVEAENFKKNEGTKLQWGLWLKYWTSTNYISDWWENYVYLRSRPSLMINSNYYIMDSHGPPPTSIQAARAAGIVHLMLQFKQRLDREQLEPMLVAKMVPLCMNQYERLFSTTRRPGKEGDVLKHWAPGARGFGAGEQYKHIVILRNGYFFRLQVELRNGGVPTAAALEEAMSAVVQSADELPPAPESDAAIPAFTSMERSRWASIRENGFGDGDNKKSLEIIEKAMFVLVLDERAPSCWTDRASTLLHSHGEPKIWYAICPWICRSLLQLYYSHVCMLAYYVAHVLCCSCIVVLTSSAGMTSVYSSIHYTLYTCHIVCRYDNNMYCCAGMISRSRCVSSPTAMRASMQSTPGLTRLSQHICGSTFLQERLFTAAMPSGESAARAAARAV
jgi:carnitine O-palmitoyltransferase 1